MASRIHKYSNPIHFKCHALSLYSCTTNFASSIQMNPRWKNQKWRLTFGIGIEFRQPTTPCVRFRWIFNHGIGAVTPTVSTASGSSGWAFVASIVGWRTRQITVVAFSCCRASGGTVGTFALFSSLIAASGFSGGFPGGISSRFSSGFSSGFSGWFSGGFSGRFSGGFSGGFPGGLSGRFSSGFSGWQIRVGFARIVSYSLLGRVIGALGRSSGASSGIAVRARSGTVIPAESGAGQRRKSRADVAAAAAPTGGCRCPRWRALWPTRLISSSQIQ